jgi:chitinase
LFGVFGFSDKLLGEENITTASISDGEIIEGNMGVTNTMAFTVTLSAIYTDTITMTYKTMSVTAVPFTDYIPVSGTLIFAPGKISKTIQVPIIGDNLDEPDETFAVKLSNPINAAIADGQGVGTILDDDDAPELTVEDVAVSEGDGVATFVVTLPTVSAQSITVTYQTADLTATAHLDYTPISGTLTFAPGEITKTLQVPIIGDELVEPDETFAINLSSPVNAGIADGQAIGTILDDDDEVQTGYRVYLPFVMR